MKTAFVTGGSKGIGRAICERFTTAGYEVTSPTRAELNLADADSVERYTTVHRNDRFDVIVNVAGINELNNMEDFLQNVFCYILGFW